MDENINLGSVGAFEVFIHGEINLQAMAEISCECDKVLFEQRLKLFFLFYLFINVLKKFLF